MTGEREVAGEGKAEPQSNSTIVTHRGIPLGDRDLGSVDTNTMKELKMRTSRQVKTNAYFETGSTDNDAREFEEKLIASNVE